MDRLDSFFLLKGTFFRNVGVGVGELIMSLCSEIELEWSVRLSEIDEDLPDSVSSTSGCSKASFIFVCITRSRLSSYTCMSCCISTVLFFRSTSNFL